MYKKNDKTKNDYTSLTFGKDKNCSALSLVSGSGSNNFVITSCNSGDTPKK